MTGPRAEARALRVLALTAALVLLVGVLVVLRATVLAPVRISSSSMLPTLGPGDVVLVSSTTGPSDLERGDLVTFRSPEDGRSALKRVVGLPGDVLVIRDAVLYVDGQPVQEPHVDHARIDGYYSSTYTVPSATFFVLGDNRGNSTDSRDYGAVPDDALQGRVLVRAWPPRRSRG